MFLYANGWEAREMRVKGMMYEGSGTDISMYYFVEKDQPLVSMPLFKGTPAESFQHV